MGRRGMPLRSFDPLVCWYHLYVVLFFFFRPELLFFVSRWLIWFPVTTVSPYFLVSGSCCVSASKARRHARRSGCWTLSRPLGRLPSRPRRRQNSSDLDIHSNQLPSDFNYTNHGILSRKQVSTLLRSSHLFLDLSDYQAFGRTGLEAMACGCVPMLPVFGGAHEYATHLQNALLVDTRSKKDILENMELFVNLNAAERNRLSDAGIRTSQQYSIGRAAYSKFQIFRDHIAA